jgi:hypothetical protein
METKYMEATAMERAKMSCVSAMNFADGWDQWKDKFKDALKDGRRFGLSDETIKSVLVKIADYLASSLCPHSKEEALMRDLWTAASPEERKVLASVVFKMIDKS